MIYLDYAAHSYADERVLKEFFNIESKYIANPNSTYDIGLKSNEKYNDSIQGIKDILKIKSGELIVTSGATESNNMALKGVATYYKNFGNHIITTDLEHSSVTGTLKALIEEGYIVDKVKLDKSGHVDLVDLKNKIRKDTILVTICGVDSETGIIQDLKEINSVIKGEGDIVFHSDLTAAVGRVNVDYNEVDLFSMSAHKIFGLTGTGLLYKKDNVMLKPIINGGISMSIFRSGTPSLGMATSLYKALELISEDFDIKFNHVKTLNNKLRDFFENIKGISINSAENNTPYIFNISLDNIKSEAFKEKLANKQIYISTKSACTAKNMPAPVILYLTGNRKKALSSIRISLSYKTTIEEIDEFCLAFTEILEGYKNG